MPPYLASPSLLKVGHIVHHSRLLSFSLNSVFYIFYYVIIEHTENRIIRAFHTCLSSYFAHSPPPPPPSSPSAINTSLCPLFPCVCGMLYVSLILALPWADSLLGFSQMCWFKKKLILQLLLSFVTTFQSTYNVLWSHYPFTLSPSLKAHSYFRAFLFCISVATAFNWGSLREFGCRPWLTFFHLAFLRLSHLGPPSLPD